jgi:hypothetical protein
MLPSCPLLLSSQRQKIRQPAPKSRDLESGVSPSSVSLNIIAVKGNTERRSPAQDVFRITTLWEVLTSPSMGDFILNLPRLHDKPFLPVSPSPCRGSKITGTCLKTVGVHLTIEEQRLGRRNIQVLVKADDGLRSPLLSRSNGCPNTLVCIGRRTTSTPCESSSKTDSCLCRGRRKSALN